VWRQGAGEFLEPARLGCAKANGAGVKGGRTGKPQASERKAGATRYTGFNPSGISQGQCVLYRYTRPVGEPVFRVSDEEGFRRARPPWPRAAEVCVSRRKPTEVGRVTRRPNIDETLVNKGRSSIRGYPRCGDRCGDTLIGGIFFKDKSSFCQRGPPYFSSVLRKGVR